MLLAITSIGYSNNPMGMEYLRHFNRMTKGKTIGKYCMLIFDGAGSYTLDDFIWFCWNQDIIPFRLIPHSTHLLQPLNLGIFGPLKHWHQVSLEESIQYGDLNYDKSQFLDVYNIMRNRTFHRNTILSA